MEAFLFVVSVAFALASLAVIPPAVASDEAPAPAKPAATPAQDDQSSRLWDMRKKVQQRAGQRAGTFLEQMNTALREGDPGGAEAALKAAIAQGKMTQGEIDGARARIDGMVSQQRQAMAAAAQAKHEAEQASSATASTSSAVSASPGNPATSGKSVHLKFDGAGMNAIRVFNVSSSGTPSDRRTDGSPGDCREAKAWEAKDDWTSYLTVFVRDDGKGTAGTYGYEVTFIEVLDRRLLSPNKVGHRQTFKGTFTIPAGKTDGTVYFEKFRWGDTKIEIRTSFR